MAKNKVNDGTLETIPGQSGKPDVVKEKQADTAVEVQKEEVAAEAKKETNKPTDEIVPDIRAQQAKDAAFIAPYAKAYPKERAFHVTSDNQVFLERDRGLAVLHQNSLGNGEKVQTIKVK